MNNLTDGERERIALMVEHLPEEEAQAAYERRCKMLSEMKSRGIVKGEKGEK